MMNRRGFLGGILAAAAAPAIISGGVLMPIKVVLRESPLVMWGDGIHDDTSAIQAFMDGKPVYRPDPSGVLIKVGDTITMPRGTFRVTSTITMGGSGPRVIDGSRIIRTGNDSGPFLEMRGTGCIVQNSMFDHESRMPLESAIRMVA